MERTQGTEYIKRDPTVAHLHRRWKARGLMGASKGEGVVNGSNENKKKCLL